MVVVVICRWEMVCKRGKVTMDESSMKYEVRSSVVVVAAAAL